MAEVKVAQKNNQKPAAKVTKVTARPQAKAAPKTATAYARFLRVSPRKARLVTNLVKGMWASDALAQLQFVHKKSSAFVRDVIKSAMANAENNFKLKKEDLYIKSITADGGAKLKRYMPRAQGRATEIRRPLTTINVLLEERIRAGKARRFTLGLGATAKKKAKLEAATKTGKQSEELTNKQEADEPKQVMRDQVEKTSQDIKKNTVTQKRRLFNRKSGV